MTRDYFAVGHFSLPAAPPVPNGTQSIALRGENSFPEARLNFVAVLLSLVERQRERENETEGDGHVFD